MGCSSSILTFTPALFFFPFFIGKGERTYVALSVSLQVHGRMMGCAGVKTEVNGLCVFTAFDQVIIRFVSF